MMREGRFRPDLYHRLNEIPLVLPPLSDRLDDIRALLKHFLTQVNIRLDGGAQSDNLHRLAKILGHRRWSGNIRQFEAEIKRMALTCEGNIPRMIQAACDHKPASEREELLQALQRTGWNRSQAARLLDISEGTVRHRIKKYNLSVLNNF
jgi:DNA-binding NtrC family response regulator